MCSAQSTRDEALERAAAAKQDADAVSRQNVLDHPADARRRLSQRRQPHQRDARARVLALLLDLRDGSGHALDPVVEADLRVPRHACLLVDRGDQHALRPLLVHDLGVAADVGCARHARRQRVHVHDANVFRADVLQGLKHRDDVSRLLLANELRDRAEDGLVVGHVERAFAEQVADQRERAVVQQQPAQHALLGLAGPGKLAAVLSASVWIVVPARRSVVESHVVMSHRDACIEGRSPVR